MRTAAYIGAAGLALVVSTLHGHALAEPGALPHTQPQSMHQIDHEAHRGTAPPLRVMPSELPKPRAEGLQRVVYGYYPYWVADLTTIRWEALTHLAWFSLDLNASGGVVARHGWPDEEVVQVAHAAGVRVDLTATLFGGADIEALCSSPSRRATAIDNIVDAVEEGDADGVSVDFEFVNGDTRDDFVLFIEELRAELDARGRTDAQISIAGPTIDWGNGIALDTLLDTADWYFVMGYGYFWSGSNNAGPGGMLRVTDDWQSVQNYSMTRTIATYSKEIPADKRHQIIWGVPYYGREWTTVSGEKGAATINSLGAVTYSQSMNDLDGGQTRLWDDGVKNPWYTWQQGGVWHQVFYDDAESLAHKYQLAIDQDLGGVGMWALNYDKPHGELWDLLEDTFSALPDIEPGHRNAPIAIDALPFHDERDTTEGASHYFNHYSCSEDTPEYGREWVYSLDVCQPGTIIASVPEYPDRDPDLHVLTEADQTACIARAHTDLEVDVQPGRYLLVVDSWVDTPVAMEGAYELDVDFVAAEGSTGCATHLTCDAGTCVCPDATQSECDGACVSLADDPAHCGACGNACETGATCVAGVCTGGGEPGTGGAPPVEPPPVDAEPVAAGEPEGCACTVVAPREDERGGALAGLALLAALGWRRRRRG